MFEYLINALSIFVNFTSNIVSVVNELELGRVCKTNAFSFFKYILHWYIFSFFPFIFSYCLKVLFCTMLNILWTHYLFFCKLGNGISSACMMLSTFIWSMTKLFVNVPLFQKVRVVPSILYQVNFKFISYGTNLCDFYIHQVLA